MIGGEILYTRNCARDHIPREMKKLGNMKVSEIFIIQRTLGSVPRGMEKMLGELEIRGRIETMLSRLEYFEESSTFLNINGTVTDRTTDPFGLL